jgi:hypothetical protein
MLERLRVEHGPVMRAKGCALSEAVAGGLKASCTVQFLNVSRPAPSALVAAATGGPGVGTP